MDRVDPSLLEIFTRLQSLGFPCMVGGSVAAMIHGEPRATLDIDIVVAATDEHADLILQSFPSSRLAPREVLSRALARHSDGSFQILDKDTGLKADVYIAGTDPLLELGLSNAIEIDIAGHSVRIAPATYVVIIKLRFYALSEQPKHLEDIRGILRYSSEAVDRALVLDHATRLGVVNAWEQCQP